MIRTLALIVLCFAFVVGPNIHKRAFAAGETSPGVADFLVQDLPDPDAYNDRETGVIYLTGSGRTHIPIYRSKDGATFKRFRKISPSKIDPNFEYCSIWASDLTKRADGSFFLSFTADRSPEGVKCKGSKYQDTPGTVYYMVASDDRLKFDFVTLFDPNGTNMPRSKDGAGCYLRQSVDSCEQTIRIDSNLFTDPDTGQEHMFYVWFWKGNNISSFPIANPTRVVRHVLASDPYEEKIVEAPDVFKRGQYYYLVYSRGSYKHNYGISYLYGTDLDDLVKGKSKSYRLLDPVTKPGTAVCDFGEKNYTKSAVQENSGHSSTIEIDGEFYIYYHKGRFTYGANGCHKLDVRDAYRSKLHFLPNGEIEQLH